MYIVMLSVKRYLVCVRKDVIIHKIWKPVNVPKTDIILILALDIPCLTSVDPI